MHKKSQGETE